MYTAQHSTAPTVATASTQTIHARCTCPPASRVPQRTLGDSADPGVDPAAPGIQAGELLQLFWASGLITEPCALGRPAPGNFQLRAAVAQQQQREALLS